LGLHFSDAVESITYQCGNLYGGFMDNRPIGVFDSGVGGLTVVKEMIDILPGENIIYFGDTARFPYGTKTVAELQSYVVEIVHFLNAEDVKIIVIACNSASAAALKKAQELFSVPIIGVIEPSAQGAVEATRNRRVGVIGTEATISSRAYEKAIHCFDAGIRIFPRICPLFADFVESGEIDSANVRKTAGDYLDPLISADIDTLVLGCTHYPLLTGLIDRAMGGNVRLISSAVETARETMNILDRRDQLRTEIGSPKYRFVSTGDGEKFLNLGSRFLGREIEMVDKVTLPDAVLLPYSPEDNISYRKA
jgi:glutamate racemase